MPEAFDAVLEGRQTVFDTLTEEFYPAGTVIKLQKQDPTARAYTDLLTITQFWWLKYLAYRQQFRLEIASTDSGLSTAMATATHVKINSDIYVIATADTIAPAGVDVTWKIFCEKFTHKAQFGSLS